MSFCPDCGSRKSPDAKFCENCRLEFRKDVSPPVRAPTNVINIYPASSSVTKKDSHESKIHLEIVDIMRILDDTNRFNPDLMYPYIEKLCELKLQGSSEASRVLEKYINHKWGVIRRKAKGCLGPIRV